jgi:hypothetical protein
LSRLEPQELGAALAQGVGGGLSLGLHQRGDALALRGVGDADEAPGLHQPDRRPLVQRLQQALQLVVRHALAGLEMPRVAAQRDGPVDRRALGVVERVLGVDVHGARAGRRRCCQAAPSAISSAIDTQAKA